MATATTGTWEIVIPASGTNIFTNPSAENDTTGYIPGAGTLARSHNDARWGVYGISYTPSSAVNDGLYRSETLAAGTYTFSVYVKGANGVPYRMFVGDVSGNVLSSITTFTGTGKWRRYSVTYTVPSLNTYKFYLQKNNSANTTAVISDGWMLTASTYLETYIDGDQPGCNWNGTSHASTSTRAASYRPGGKIVDLADYSFYVKQAIGAGMPPIANMATEYGQNDGSFYQGTRVKARPFSLVGYVPATGIDNYHQLRDVLIQGVNPHLTAVPQPMTLRYTGPNGMRSIQAVFEGGLDTNTDNYLFENQGLRFTAHDPYWYSAGESSQVLTAQTTIPSGGFIARRSSTGVWSVPGVALPASSGIYCVAYDQKNNRYYFGGSFSSIGDVSASNIARYDPSIGFQAMGTGANNEVYTIAVDTNGDVYVGGLFSSAGGVANTSRIAKWNGSAWSALGTGAADQSVRSIVIGPDRTIYAGGLFTQMGGVSNTARIAKWNGSAWSALSTGMNGGVYNLAFGADSNLYAVGTFTTAGGTTVNMIAKWNGSAWSGLAGGVGTGTYIYAIAVGLDGTIYVSGYFTVIGGVSANYVAKWNGVAWSAMGTGFTATGGVDPIAYNLVINKTTGILYALGQMTAAGGYTLPDSIARWTGTTWLPVDANFNGTVRVWNAVQSPDSTMTFVYSDASGSIVTGANTTVTNSGTALTYPKFVITGPASGTAVTFYQILNITTGDSLYFASGTQINAGETWTIDLTPGKKTFTSDFRGNLIGKFIPGSNVASFKLLPGANILNVYADNTTATVECIWQERHWSLDGGAS